ncbi:DNA-binding protein [Agrobacterium tumefaciens]|uniref:DNA-binding protein n=1 Tax=Agrobacterium tumefaciens TaxID=358 RepID=UPI0021D052D3|nr:DNA-binding protein [Agrobacterium tumefaciens]
MAEQIEQSDVIWGAGEIAKAIGTTERATYHMLELGKIPARKIGKRWVASRTKLQQHFEGEAGEQA